MKASWEVRRNDDGTIDEIVAEGCVIHLEQMDKGSWYLGLYADHSPNASLLQVDIVSKKRVKVLAQYGPNEYPEPVTGYYRG